MKSQNGFNYEKTVLDTIKEVGISGLINQCAGANSSAPDADFEINGKIYNLEIKLNSRAQMGGTSIIFENEQFRTSTSIQEDINEVLIESVKTKQEQIRDFIQFICENEKNLKINKPKLPLICSKETWELAQKNNKLVNLKVPCSIEFLKQHLLKKNIYYIQIGGKGAYKVSKENPAKLPLEELSGDLTVEIRTGRSGSRHTRGFKVVNGAIRIQGRLNIKNENSKYTFDDVSSIKQLLNDSCKTSPVLTTYAHDVTMFHTHLSEDIL